MITNDPDSSDTVCSIPLVTKFLLDFRVCSLKNANVIESIMLDFPEPLCPTNTVIPGLNLSWVFLWIKSYLILIFLSIQVINTLILIIFFIIFIIFPKIISDFLASIFINICIIRVLFVIIYHLDKI